MYLGQKKSLSRVLEKRHSRAGYRKLSRCCLFPFQGQPLVPPVRELGRIDSRGGKFARFFVRRSCFDETVPSGEKTRRRTMAASLFLRARRRAPDERGKGRPRRTRVDCDSCQNRWQTRSPVSPLSSLLSSLARALSRLSLSSSSPWIIEKKKEKGGAGEEIAMIARRGREILREEDGRIGGRMGKQEAGGGGYQMGKSVERGD